MRKAKRKTRKPSPLQGLRPGLRMKGGVRFDPNVNVGVKAGWVTHSTLEEVDLAGRPAAWLDGHILAWEVEGISYTVGGLDLSLDEATRIAESLK